MKTYIASILFLAFSNSVISQQKIPDWFIKNMEESVGTWTTDNSTYKNENEPFDQYGMVWEWGIGKQSISGKLYGLIKGKKQGTFWEFRQYWDIGKNQGIVVQYGSDSAMGIGPMTKTGEHQTEMVQEFVSPNGDKNIHGHRSTLKNNALITTSYDISTNGDWKKRRSYTWTIENKKESIALGLFSISLAVKNIQTSKAFYKKMGFEVIDGDPNQKWVIMKNENSKIGLFQGLFPSNTLTFNPENIRSIHKKIKEEGISIMIPSGTDKKNGAASFMITDPDGNPILIDQH